jgi:hypothetical protein
MFNTQIVYAEDLQQNKTLQKQFLDVMLAKSKNMGIAPNKQETLMEFQRFLKDENKFIDCFITAYNGDEFVGFMLLKKLNRGVTNAVAFTSINFVYQNLLDWSKPHPWKSALDAAAKHMVQNHIYDVYSMQPNRPAIQKHWKSGKDAMRYCREWYDDEKETYKWHKFVENVLEPEQRPENEYIYKLTMNSTLQKVPTVIRRFTLKNEYRPDWDKVKHWWPED